MQPPEHHNSPSPVVTPVSDDEPLTRYVTDEEYCRTSKPVHWRVFNPRLIDSDLSIARIYGLANDAIWLLGDQLAGIPSGRKVHGRADFKLPAVVAARDNGSRLSVVPDNDPPRHASIVGWPVDRNARKALAMSLAAESVAVVR